MMPVTWAPLLRMWLYLFADTGLWLAVMSRTETLVEERGAMAYAGALERLRAAEDRRHRWIWRHVAAQLVVRRPGLSAAA